MLLVLQQFFFFIIINSNFYINTTHLQYKVIANFIKEKAEYHKNSIGNNINFLQKIRTNQSSLNLC